MEYAVGSFEGFHAIGRSASGGNKPGPSAGQGLRNLFVLLDPNPVNPVNPVQIACLKFACKPSSCFSSINTSHAKPGRTKKHITDWDLH